MMTRHAVVGGTQFILYDDAGVVVAQATIHHGESEGDFVACLLDWLSHRRAADALASRPRLALVSVESEEERPHLSRHVAS